jgi:L-alanine-DL-glutamate epimerase-like enolase superfamily enzyme
MFTEPLVFENGHITMPNKPGLGLELIPGKVEELAL